MCPRPKHCFWTSKEHYSKMRNQLQSKTLYDFKIDPQILLY